MVLSPLLILRAENPDAGVWHPPDSRLQVPSVVPRSPELAPNSAARSPLLLLIVDQISHIRASGPTSTELTFWQVTVDASSELASTAGRVRSSCTTKISTTKAAHPTDFLRGNSFSASSCTYIARQADTRRSDIHILLLRNVTECDALEQIPHAQYIGGSRSCDTTSSTSKNQWLTAMVLAA